MKNKRLALVLAPMLPLTAIGIVEVVNAVVSRTQPTPVGIVEVKPIGPQRIERPEPPAPAPAPVTVEVGPQPVRST